MSNSNDNRITYFGETDFRNKKTRFGIKAKDRAKHMYIIGKTGMGKSTLLENMAIQDIQNGEGVTFLDPHGGTAEKLLDYVPEERIKDVIYFAPFDIANPVSFNVMEDVGYDKRFLVASGLMSTFKKIWQDAWSARMEYILNNILLALLEYPGATLLGVNRMLSDKDYRKIVVENVKDPAVKSFWIDEFAKYGDRYMQEAGAAIQNKIGQFTSNPMIRNIIGQSKSTFNLRDVMDSKKILIVNLSKGQIGDQNVGLLGGMLVTKIYLAAMSRADLSAEKIKELPQFYFYVDEFQNFANESFADILSEARKYKLNLIIAHQYVEQMTEEVKAAVFGNVGTTVTFRVGPFDAEILEKIFLPTFTKEDIVNLGFTQIYLTLMVDGVGSRPFSASSMAPIDAPIIPFKNEIIKNSREVYARVKDLVEKDINDFYKPVELPKKEKFDKTKTDFLNSASQPKPVFQNKITVPSKVFPQSNFKKDFIPKSTPISAPKKENYISIPDQGIASNLITQNKNSEIKKVIPEQKTTTGAFESKKLSVKTTPSPKLKDLLSQLEGREKGEINNPPLKVPEHHQKTISLNDLQKPVSVSTFSKIPQNNSKDASLENRSKLKDLLSKVMTENKDTKKSSEVNKDYLKKDVLPEPKEEQKKEESTKPEIKEVPEDVLRKVLE